MCHKNMKGFTLIELIVVIVILGILSVTVAPKFLSVSEDAVAATNKYTMANVKAAIELIKVKSIASNISKDGVIKVADSSVKLFDYWPECVPGNTWCNNTDSPLDGNVISSECIQVIEVIMQKALSEYAVTHNTSAFTCYFRVVEDPRYGFDYRPLGKVLTLVEP